MKKNYILLLFLCLFSNFYNAQVQLSVLSEVSIITAGPGTELYEAFGHAAIRVKDPVLNLDLIYNYGVFDFNQPNFELNFIKGKPLYKLARYDFKYFLSRSKKEKRWVKQLVLNLNLQEKKSFFIYLENNAAPKNASYLYDPYFNNCATKLRDITTLILDDNVVFKNDKIDKNRSLRQLMNQEIPWNTWGSFGINLALGSQLDKKIDLEKYMYLPDYLNTIFKSSTINKNNISQKLVSKEDTLLEFTELKQNILILNPLMIFSLISLIGLFFTYTDFKDNKRTKWLDSLLLFSTGIIGFLIVFLWFFTDHSTTPNNFNFLWAFAPNLIVGLLMLTKNQQKWMSIYFKFLLFFLMILPILWVTKIQLFPISVIPLLILLFVRYLFLSKKQI